MAQSSATDNPPVPAVPAAAASATAPATLPPVKVTGRQPDRYTVRETDAATKLTLSPRETPQAVTVITRERLDDQNLTSVRQVLDNTAGIYSNAYDTERVMFYTRGFLIDSLLYDGVPAMANFTTKSIDETIDTAFYERIEVVRGASGLLSGAGNPAASINLVRKHADSRVPTASVDVSLGSWKTLRVQADASAPITADGRIRGRVVLSAEDKESYQNLYDKRTYSLYGIVDADLTEATRLSVGADYQDNRPRSVTWGSFPLFLADGTMADWPRSVTTSTDWAYWNRRTRNTFVELRHTFDNGWTLRSSLNRRQYDEDLSLFYVYGFPDPVTGLGLDPYAYRNLGKIVENALDLYASGPFELLGRKHELVVGYNGSRSRNTGTEQAAVGVLPAPGNFFQWDGSYPEPTFGPSSPLVDMRTNQDALYAAARFSLADSVKLITGARYGRWDVDSFYVYDDNLYSKYSFNKLLPYAGVVWDALPEYSVFASYNTIFKPQSERGIDGRYLDPINGHSFEVGVKGEHFDRRLNTSFTVFSTRQNKVAAPLLDPVTGTPVELPDGSAVSQAVDGTRTRGVEVEASGRFSNAWQGSIGWTRYLTRDSDGQAIRRFVPNTQLRLFTTWKPAVLASRLSVGGGVNWQSATSTTVGTPSGGAELRQGSFSQVQLMTRYEFTPTLSLQLNANNVFDKKFYVLDQYDNTYFGAPANYTLTLRATF